jgi:hypothetical protein
VIIPALGRIPSLALPDRCGDQAREDEREATNRQRKIEADGQLAYESEEIRPDRASEVTGSIDDADADAGGRGRHSTSRQTSSAIRVGENEAGHGISDHGRDRDSDKEQGVGAGSLGAREPLANEDDHRRERTLEAAERGFAPTGSCVVRAIAKGTLLWATGA